MKQKSTLIGFLFGLIAPLLGLVIGLTFSPILANILMFPYLIVGFLTGLPLLEMPTLLRLILFFVSGAVWAVIFYAIAKTYSKLTKK